MEKKVKKNKIKNVPQTGIFLSDFNTMKVGGIAEFFLKIENELDLAYARKFSKENKLKIFVLGGGSNVFFSDGLCNGLFLLNKFKKTKEIKELKSCFKVSVSSGEDWDKFVDFLIKNNIFGLENLSGIPGTVGGGPVQNIGAYGVEIANYINFIKYYNFKDGEFHIIKKEDCQFGYRDSIFKKRLSNVFISEINFLFPKKNKININYKDLQIFFDKKIPDPKSIRRAVLKIRNNKFPDLKKIGTVGSFFKNVVLNKKDAKFFLNKFPDTPSFPFEKKIKIPTGYILDKICNLKGYREGNVGLFEKQSLVLVNFGNATAKEILDFRNKIKKIVFDKTGIKIEEEVVIV